MATGTQTARIQAHDRFLELSAELDDQEFADAVAAAASGRFGGDTRCITALLGALRDEQLASEADVLDAAAVVAARHRSLNDREAFLQSLLSFVAAQSDLTRRIGGEPRVILDRIQLAQINRSRLAGEAMRAIWDQPMLRPRDAAVALGAAPANRERVRQLRLRSELLGLRHGRGYLYPAFQFDLERRCVDPAVSAVNGLLDARGDPWGVASWWFSINDRLGVPPRGLVGTGRDDDLAAVAHAMTDPVG